MLKYFLILILFTVTLQSQPIDKSSYYNFGKKLYTSFFIEPSSSMDSSEITIFYKISNAAISFSKDTKDPRISIFKGYPAIETIFTDNSGIIRERIFWKDTVSFEDFDKTNKKHEYIYGYSSVFLKNDEYKINIKLLDKYSKKIDDINLNMKIGFKNNISSLAFLEKNDNKGYNPYILNGNINFNSKTAVAVFYHKNENTDLHFKCTKVELESSKFSWDKDIDFSGNIEQMPENNTNIKMISFKDKPFLSFNQNKDRKYLYSFDLPAETFVPGRYELIIQDNNSGDTLRNYFKVIWEDKPLSLRDIDYAIKSMYYIMTEEEHDKLDEGSDEERFDKIINFWKEKDPTPNTPYNEAMAEYFRRVDFAAFNYRTLKERDGVQTDRGKIHILYGTPDKTDKILKDDNTVERWTYKKPKKVFIFEMVSSGVYKLVEIKEEKN